MNSEELVLHSQYFHLNGFTLTVEEKTALQSSLVLLKTQNHFHRVNYWGKIFGVDRDYHIAQGFAESIVGGNSNKKFYSTDGGLSWVLLSDPSEEQTKYIDMIRGLFIGDPSFVYKISETIPEQEQQQSQDKPKEEGEEGAAEGEGEEEDEEKKAAAAAAKKKKANVRIINILEESRLAFMLRSIEHDTSVAPRGALLLNSYQEVVSNPAFTGLDHRQSGNLRHYVHARLPEKISMDNLLEREHLSKSLDFLDRIDADVPTGSWSLQYEPGNNAVVGRSLLWPGYVFYHVPNTRIFGAYYFGCGEKNFDLPFML